MVVVRDTRELRAAYESMFCLEELLTELGRDKNHNEFIDEYKKAIRKYNSRVSDRHLIKGDVDGYVELIELPAFLQNLDEAEDYFLEEEYKRYIPSQWDCTGQQFTMWYKVFKRRNRFMAYHKVCYDV